MAHWPELTLALTIALITAYIIADAIARIVESGLRGILNDEQEKILVDRPKTVVRIVLFLITGAALAFPAIRIAGVRTEFGGNPEEFVRWLFRDGLKIAVICIAAYAAIRIGNAAARRFERELSAGTGQDVIERTKRAQTLARITQKTLSIIVVGMAGLMILQQLDVDITPVLTGAGIVGLAVGFGAQTLVRDVISGFFLILEDQVRVGDVAIVNGQGGLVEAVNLRTIVLRDEEGTVHVVPNGEVKTLSNRSKDFSFYVFTLTVPFETDPDVVAKVIQDVSETLMQDENFRPHILAPVEVYGVEDFQPGQMKIKGRIKTIPQKQWFVGRELRKRIAATFKARQIGITVPHMNVTIDRLADVLNRDATAKGTEDRRQETEDRRQKTE